MKKFLKEQILSMETIKKLALAMVLSFLGIHILFFFLFMKYAVWPMMYFNIFSIVFYLVMIPLVFRTRLRFFVVAVYLEVVIHMSLAVYFTGWENGFQNSLIGMSILAFYAEYIGHYMKIRYIRAVPLCMVGMGAYLAMLFVSNNNTPLYPFPEQTTFWLQLGLGVIVFVITIAYLYFLLTMSTKYEAALALKADYDQLTGLPNRYYSWDYLSRLDREDGFEDHWIAMLDIDDFKNINDTYGHNTGDFALKSLADLLKESCPDMLVSRWGGEEFLICGKNVDGRQDGIEHLETIRKDVQSRTFRYEKITLRFTITIGVAEYTEGTGIRDWIGAADEKLYEGKRSGKNKVVR